LANLAWMHHFFEGYYVKKYMLLITFALIFEFYSYSMEISLIETINRLENYLQAAVEFEHFSGVVMVVNHGMVILNQGYGPANVYGKNEQNTIVHVASITKQFTAAAILKLWESGKIGLHASINTYLPKEYQSDIWEKVTVHHLLSHTSGIADYDEKYFSTEKKGFCFKEVIKEMIVESRVKKLEFEPGYGWHYCNIGYTLLGEILQSQTGQSYSKLIREFFFIPAGMVSSGIHDADYVAKSEHAIGYKWDEKQIKLVDDDEKTLPATPPDGGMFTTSEDLYKWSYVIAGKRPDILSSEIIKLMITPKPTTLSMYGGYGYGLFIDDSSCTQRIHHPGWILGFRSHFCLYPKKEIYISVFCNNTTTDPMQMTSGLAEIMGVKRPDIV